jgi:RNA polymerase sigma-70 factor (ECF subfamily)
MDKLAERVNKEICDISRGDKQALDRLYEITGGYLLFMARKYIYDVNLAEDVVSETYLKVVKNACHFDPAQNGLNWLFKIVKNTALNYNLRERRFKAEDIDEHRDIADVFSCTPEEQSDYCRLRELIKELPEEERELLYYRYWEGYTLRELADKAGKPVMTLHDKLKKILGKLKKLV